MEWVGGSNGSWDTAANWLDTTTNTHHVPDATDAVTIAVPGVTVTANGIDKALSVQVSNGSDLTISGGTLTLGAPSQIDSGLTLTGGTLILGGTLTLTGTNQWTGGDINLDGNNLVNQGSLTAGVSGSSTGETLLSRNSQNTSLGGMLVNSSTITLQGTASLNVGDNAELDNTAQGSVVFAANGQVNAGGGTGSPALVNAGTIDKSGGTGTSRIAGIGFDNTGGTVEVDTGTLTLDAANTNTSTSTGGTFTVAQNATLDLTGGSAFQVYTGTYTGTGAGTVLLGSGTLNIGTGGATFNFAPGLFQWNGGDLNLQGNTLTNAGTITVGSSVNTKLSSTNGPTSTPLAGGTLVNSGTIDQPGAGVLTLNNAVVLDNQGSYQLSGAGFIQDSGSPPATLANAGTLTVSAPAATAEILNMSLDNSGTLTTTAGTLALNSDYINNTGTIEADGGKVSIDNRSTGAQFNGNLLSGGTWVARGGGTLAFGTAFTSSQANLTVDGSGSAITGVPALALNTGTITVTNGATFSTSTNLDNRGTIALGPAGTLSVGGSYTQESTGTLDVQLGGAPASGQFGNLAVAKVTTLGGVLRSDLTGGYTPTAGDSFPVVTSTGSSGSFDAVVLPATATVAFGAAVNPNGVVLTAQAATATPTTITLTSSQPNGATYGQPLTFTATVAATAGSATPTGTVQFQIDGVNFGGPVTLSGGSATLAAALTAGQHTVNALYVSDTSQFADSATAAPLSQSVNPGTPAAAPNVSLFFTQFGTGSNNGVSQAAIGYDGTSLTLGTPTPVNQTISGGDGLIFLPNGNLLIGGPSVTEVNPTTGAVVGTIPVTGDHLALDPSGTTVWTSDQGSNGVAGHTGSLVEIPLDPFGTSITHTLHGDDAGVTQLAFAPDGTAYYTNSTSGGLGVIDLSTFTTKRLISGLASAHGLTYDPYTGDLFLVSSSRITQFDPRTQTIVSELDFPGSGFELDQEAVDGKGHLYAADNTGHLIFIDYSATGLIGDPHDFVTTPFLATDLDDVAPLSGLGSPGTPITVNHHLPTSGYTVDPMSITPQGAVSASDVVWDGQIPAGSTAPLTFQLTGQVTNLAPGEVRQISEGTTVTAVVGAPNGSVLPVSIQLPPLVVTADHVINLTPPAQTVDRNAETTYTVELTNPLSTSVTYTLSLDGLDGMMTSLASTVTVAADQTVDVPLTVDVPASATPGTDVFEVLAQTAAGATDSVEGQLTVQSQVFVPSLAVSTALTPTQASAGQGDSAVYVLTLTNAGDTTDSYTLAGSFPSGVTASFSQTTITVPPGESNFRDVTLTLTPALGTTPGDDPFTVTATSTTNQSVSSTSDGNLDVLPAGVSVALTPSSTAPGNPLQLQVTNTGNATDTFNLALGGPAALVATLAQAQVTLATGASTTVGINTNTANFADPGDLQLLASATSQSDPSVQAAATSNLSIAQTNGLTAGINPGAQTVTVPGTASFLVQVNNTGNAEDAYSATIIGTSGPVTASLTGLDGSQTQSIPIFRLPGLSQGALQLNASLVDDPPATVTIRIQSLNDPSRFVDMTATLYPAATPATPGTPSPPTTSGSGTNTTASASPAAAPYLVGMSSAFDAAGDLFTALLYSDGTLFLLGPGYFVEMGTGVQSANLYTDANGQIGMDLVYRGSGAGFAFDSSGSHFLGMGLIDASTAYDAAGQAVVVLMYPGLGMGVLTPQGFMLLGQNGVVNLFADPTGQAGAEYLVAPNGHLIQSDQGMQLPLGTGVVDATVAFGPGGVYALDVVIGGGLGVMFTPDGAISL